MAKNQNRSEIIPGPDRKRRRISKETSKDDDLRENELARELWNSCVPCNKGKRKEKNLKKSAEILHSLGLLYRKQSQDKISLIQSAGLLNAALIRNPTDEIKKDLSELHKHVLQLAVAKNKDVKLEEKSSLVKKQFKNLRIDIEKKLKNVKKVERVGDEKAEKIKIKKIQEIQNHISDKYIEIMTDVSRYCEEIKGSLPCKYAIVGMGSMARKELTPYSDFEHMIVLENSPKKYEENDLEQFRWFSVIFHLIILGMQETIIPSLFISSLNDKTKSLGDWFFDAVTTKGVSFDGLMPRACKFPLGSQNSFELIRSVDHMQEYLKQEENLKNGYHLSDILSQICFVSGEKTVYELFHQGVLEFYRSKSSNTNREEIKNLVKEDLKKYSIPKTVAKIKPAETFNVKTIVYRAMTLFISALKRCYKVAASSSFEIIEEMRHRGLISAYESRKLSYAVAVSCEIRLRLYTKSHSQNDSSVTSHSTTQKKAKKQFSDLVGKSSTLSFFQIAHCLQIEVAQLIDYNEIFYDQQPALLNLHICYKLVPKHMTANLFRCLPNQGIFDEDLMYDLDFDDFLEQMEEATQEEKKRLTRSSTKTPEPHTTVQTKENAIGFFQMAISLYNEDLVKEASEFFLCSLEIFLKLSQDPKTDLDIAECHYRIGECCLEMEEYRQSKRYFLKAHQILLNLDLKSTKKNQDFIMWIYYKIGQCFANLNDHKKAINRMTKALNICQKLLESNKYINIKGDILQEIGICLLNLNKPNDGIKKLKEAMNLFSKLKSQKERDENIAGVWSDIAHCYMYLVQYKDALEALDKSFELYNSQSSEENTEEQAEVLRDKGFCLKETKKFDLAIESFQESLKIYFLQNNEEDDFEEDDLFTAGIHEHLSNCFLLSRDYRNCITHALNALNAYRMCSEDPNKDEDVSNALFLIGCGYMGFGKRRYSCALQYFQDSLHIKKAMSGRNLKNANLGEMHYMIGVCMVYKEQWTDAITHLEESRDIWMKKSADKAKSNYLAKTLIELSKCQVDSSKNESTSLLKEAFEKLLHTSTTEDIQCENLTYMSEICTNLIALEQFQDALCCLRQFFHLLQQIQQPLDLPTTCIFKKVHLLNGMCKMILGSYQDAIDSFDHVECIQETVENADLICLKGVCLMKMGKTLEAMKCFESSLKIYQDQSQQDSIKGRFAKLFNFMGECLLLQKDYI